MRRDTYMFKVNNRNSRTRCRICSKLTIKTPERRYWRRSGVFIVNFKQISHFALVFLLLTLSRYTPAGRWPLGLQIPKNPRLNRVKRMSQVIESHSNTAASFHNVLIDTWWDFFPKNVQFFILKNLIRKVCITHIGISLTEVFLYSGCFLFLVMYWW